MIRKAKLEDIDSLLVILNDAKELLKSQGSTQWNGRSGYPNKDDLLNDIKNSHLYVYLENQEILGFCAICDTPEESYQNIKGSWLTKKNYLTIHRIAVKKTAHGKKVSNQLINYAKEKAIKENKSLRADTHKLNKSMQKKLSEEGFILCGEINLITSDADPIRLAYEYKR